MKTWKHAIIGIIALFALAFTATACKDVNDNGKEPPKPIEVTFNVPDEYTNLNKTKPITILFPATFTVARMDNIKGKFIDSMAGLDEEAGRPNDFKVKINAILDRGLTVTIEVTNEFNYFIKVVGKQLVAETSFLDRDDIFGAQIAGTIIVLINEGKLVP
jgi:hypothetical protein